MNLSISFSFVLKSKNALKNAISLYGLETHDRLAMVGQVAGGQANENIRKFVSIFNIIIDQTTKQSFIEHKLNLNRIVQLWQCAHVSA